MLEGTHAKHKHQRLFHAHIPCTNTQLVIQRKRGFQTQPINSEACVVLHHEQESPRKPTATAPTTPGYLQTIQAWRASSNFLRKLLSPLARCDHGQ